MKQSLRIVLLMMFSLLSMQSVFAQIGITVSFGPPALPIYEQPVCPEDGYLWAPGYWAYDPDDGYYWVPGTWVPAPEPGYLWTPAWWGWENGGFLFHEGYWATEVGFYGGIDYGFGYFGTGFGGGRWEGGGFRYNTAVLHVDTTIIHNTYIDRTVVVNHNESRLSYNGGEGGVTARPTAEEQRVDQARHLPPTSEQTQHLQAARSNPQLRASANQGKPPIAATARAGSFSGRGVVEAKAAGAPYHAPARNAGQPAGGRESETPRAGERSATPTHASELQEHQPASVPSTGNSKLDNKYQKQQAQLAAKQNQEHQKLAQQQAKEDKKANLEQKQQVEQKHQQQTQQLEQRHTQEQQQLQMRQAPRAESRPR